MIDNSDTLIDGYRWGGMLALPLNSRDSFVSWKEGFVPRSLLPMRSFAKVICRDPCASRRLLFLPLFPV